MNNRILNEQYYGKNTKTLEMEKIFANIKKDMEKSSSKELYNADCRKYEKEFEKVLKELFNFKEVSFDIKNIGSINAYTLAKTADDFFAGPLTNKEVNKKYGGIRYTDEANRALMVTISLEIIRKEECTPAILTAVLLHEIGHNFYIEDTMVFRIDTLITSIFTFGYTINSVKFFSASLTNYFKDTAFWSFLRNIKSILMRYIGYINSLQYVFYGAMSLASFNFDIFINAMKMLNPLNIIFTENTYNNELFADNFATSYGYGPEIAEFSKIFNLNSTGFELLDSFNNKNNFFKFLNDIFLKNRAIFDSIDPFKNRASEVTRVIDQLNYLKANLKDIKDKNKRKAIEKDIASIEKTLKEFEKASNDPVSVQRYNKLKNSFAFDRNGGELAYRVRRRHYDVKGNWKNLI